MRGLESGVSEDVSCFRCETHETVDKDRTAETRSDTAAASTDLASESREALSTQAEEDHPHHQQNG